MKVSNISCSNCGAPLVYSQDTLQVTCAYCGSTNVLEPSPETATLRSGEKIGQAIQNSSAGTQSAIRDGSQVTQIELKRLQLGQEISGLHIQLSTLQSEIRSLERQKANRKIKQQLRELEQQEKQILAQIRALQTQLNTLKRPPAPVHFHAAAGSVQPTQAKSAPQSSAPRDWSVTFFLCLFLGLFGVHRFYTGHLLVGILQLFTLGAYGIWTLIDLVLIVTQKYRDARGNPLAEPNVRLGSSCLLTGLVVFGTAFICALASVPLERAFFGADTAILPPGSTEASTTASPFAPLAVFVALFAGAVFFAYRMKPDAAVWKSIRKVLPGKKD